MILYTKDGCPMCNVIKMKLDNARIKYEINQNEKEMEELGIDMIPVLKTDKGNLLSFKEILGYIEEVTK